MKKLPPTHPGTILKEELVQRRKISQVQLARDLRVSFSPELWLDLQRDYELECLEEQKNHGVALPGNEN